MTLLAGCLGSTTKVVSGEIKDDGISLATNHAGPSVRFSLTNAGSVPCHLAVVIAPVPTALPVVNGQVAVDASGAANGVRPPLGGDSAFFAWVQPGERYELEVALEGAPRSGERVILCNEPGDYEHGRYAVLRFDR
jgi:hypothetical protein